jgi:hypothetical protein
LELAYDSSHERGKGEMEEILEGGVKDSRTKTDHKEQTMVLDKALLGSRCGV